MNERIKAGSDIHAGDGGYGIGTKENYDAFVKVRNKSLAAARIKEIAVEAKLEHCVSHVRLQDFAERIIKECAELVEYNSKGAGRDIREHFGIEE